MGELLVVVLLLVLASTIFTVAWSHMRSNVDTLSAARLSHQYLIQARMLSVYRNVNHFVVYDPSERTIAIYEDTGTTPSSFDNGDDLVQRVNWPDFVDLALPGTSLTSPMGGSTVTNAWSLPLPDSTARWGTNLRGVMTTPAGAIQSAGSTPAVITSGVMIFSGSTGHVTAVGLRGQFGVVKSYRLDQSSWGDLG